MICNYEAKIISIQKYKSEKILKFGFCQQRFDFFVWRIVKFDTIRLFMRVMRVFLVNIINCPALTAKRVYSLRFSFLTYLIICYVLTI